MQAVNTQPWLERARTMLAHPRLPDAASLALVALLGWQLAELTWATMPAPEAARLPQTAPAVADGAGGEDSTPPSARLARLHLFGEPAPPEDGDDEQARETATDAPETQLNLTLKGLYAPGEDRGIAIIATGSSPEKVYSVGDTIAGSARITGIFQDRVVLRRNGRAETLRLDLAELPAGADTASTAAGDDSNGPADDEVVERARALRDRLQENPFDLARMVRFQPHVEDGELVGFRIEPRSEEAELLEEVGIRPSDVVTRVNGIALDDRQQGNRALQELRNASTINVTILRDGRSQRLSIPIGNPG